MLFFFTVCVDRCVHRQGHLELTRVTGMPCRKFPATVIVFQGNAWQPLVESSIFHAHALTSSAFAFLVVWVSVCAEMRR